MFSRPSGTRWSIRSLPSDQSLGYFQLPLTGQKELHLGLEETNEASSKIKAAARQG
jgi:hypothetical protein